MTYTITVCKYGTEIGIVNVPTEFITEEMEYSDVDEHDGLKQVQKRVSRRHNPFARAASSRAAFVQSGTSSYDTGTCTTGECTMPTTG